MTEQVNDATSGASFTGNPKAPKDNTVITEKPGEITSDSLAAESLKDGGSFADGKATAGSVPSGSTTANTTDNTAATILPPTVDASHRSDGDVTLGGGASGGSGGLGSMTGTSGGASAPASAEEPIDDVMKPKGENLKEGGFDSGAPNASFNNEIGTKKDPGRLAEQKFASDNAVGDAGYAGAHQAADIHQGGFENLKEESA